MPDLIALMKAGVKAVPATKYAVGLTGVAAAAGIVYSILGDKATGIATLVAFLGLMILLFVFAIVVGNPGPMRPAGIALVYTIVIVTIVSFVLLFTGVFFDWPKPLPALIGSTFGQNNLAIIESACVQREGPYCRTCEFPLSKEKVFSPRFYEVWKVGNPNQEPRTSVSYSCSSMKPGKVSVRLKGRFDVAGSSQEPKSAKVRVTLALDMAQCGGTDETSQERTGNAPHTDPFDLTGAGRISNDVCKVTLIHKAQSLEEAAPAHRYLNALSDATLTIRSE